MKTLDAPQTPHNYGTVDHAEYADLTKDARRLRPKLGRPAVRPNISDPKAMRIFFERMMAGEAVSRICRDESMPSKTDLYAELASNREFRTSFSRARRNQLVSLAEEMIELADGATDENIERVNLQLKVRRWNFARVAGRKYGTLNDLFRCESDPMQELFKAMKETLGPGGQALPSDKP